MSDFAKLFQTANGQGYVEPHYVSDDMIRGHDDEIEARSLYAKHHAPVAEVGFITNSKCGFTIGYSPDALVGDNGLIEQQRANRPLSFLDRPNPVYKDTAR
jgi:hypothetical protein